MKQSYNGIGTSNPEAYITRTKEKNRGRLKVYSNNTVYLEKEEEFELELFNSYTSTILVKIELNGEFISNTGLVLKPAQRVYLERYFDSDKKFKFDIYEVENWETLKSESDKISSDRKLLEKELTLRQQLLNLTTSEEEKEVLRKRVDELKTQTTEMIDLANTLTQRSNSVKNATKYNGKVKIHFFKEEKLRSKSFNDYDGYIPLNGNGYFPYSGYGGSIPSTNIGGFVGKTTTNLTNTDILRGSSITTSSMDYPITLGDNATFSCSTASGTLSFTDNNPEKDSLILDSLKSLSEEPKKKSLKNKETGRIAEGSISNQKFETVNMNFSSYSFHTIEYNILPYSDKPLEMKDLRQYCSECGKKLSPSDNFCSSCGKKA